VSFLLVPAGFRQYSWYDVKPMARELFWNWSYMLPWAQDAWNLLMFGRPVAEDEHQARELHDLEQADAILWLLALADVLMDYQIRIDHASSYEREYELCAGNISCGDTILELLAPGIWKRYLDCDDIHRIADELGEEEWAPGDEDALDEAQEIKDEVWWDEIKTRRYIFTHKLRCLLREDTDILLFMTGHHWRRHYTDFHERVDTLWERMDAGEIEEWEVESELEKLSWEYPVSVEDVEDYLGGPIDFSDLIFMGLASVYDWIGSGMPRG